MTELQVIEKISMAGFGNTLITAVSPSEFVEELHGVSNGSILKGGKEGKFLTVIPNPGDNGSSGNSITLWLK